MMEECLNKGSLDDTLQFSFIVKLCQCSIDKALTKYSVEELIEIDDYGGNFIEFTEDMERFGKKCAIEILKKKCFLFKICIVYKKNFILLLNIF